ncbi:M56 family metallopeptidase [Dyella sp. GSA-30]|uniref:M56 family metallopeptidase n=1 Tax=Dyella sp. GSA-30 TaxID=2994496 RepID=UPI00249378B4|nr:M56 family metallopeptidase [Dyella sp. GSA-30]
MSSLESWLPSLWLAILASTLSLVWVFLMRRPMRRWLGAETAFFLWALPPVAIVMTQLPHPTGIALPPLPPLIVSVTQASAIPAAHGVSSTLHASSLLVLTWLIGVAICAVTAVARQRRYERHLHTAVRWTAAELVWPIWQAPDTRTGPAMVGAWRPRIVLPGDFEQRYDATEQALILAHEASHASRRDGWWCLVAQAMACLFWFHPLVWWALPAFRHDQELACDAAVMRKQPGQRRRYALAMLKTQGAIDALPVGCAWSPRHPVMERVAMLKRSQVGCVRRWVGKVTVVGLVCALGGVVYASAVDTPSASPDVKRFTLKLEVATKGQPAHLHSTSCLAPGREHYELTDTSTEGLPPWHALISVSPAEKGQLMVNVEMSGGTLDKTINPKILVLAGQQGTIQVGEKIEGGAGKPEEDRTISIKATPSVGC